MTVDLKVLRSLEQKTTLDHASNNEIACKISYTVNKAGGNDTGLLINQVDTASPGTSRLAEFQTGGVAQGWLSNSGVLYLSTGLYTKYYTAIADSNQIILQTRNWTISGSSVDMATGTFSGAGVTQNAVVIKPTWNQTTTSAGTDLLINRTETAIGSGAQLLLDAQVGSVSKFSVDRTGAIAIGNAVQAAVGVASTHKITMVIGGVTYYLLATNV